MKKNTLVPQVLALLSGLFVIFGVWLFRKRMTVFDTLETDPFPFFAQYLLIAIVAAGIFLLVSLGMMGRRGKIKWIIYLTATVMVFTFNSLSLIQSATLLHEAETRDPEYCLTRISLKDFGVTANEEDERIFYMGRDDCGECLDIHPDLRGIAQRYHVKIHYYNTMLDRDTNQSALQKVLDHYQIKAVPTILVMRGQEIIARFSSREAVAGLEQFLSASSE